MEVAAYLTEKAHSVSVVELEETPFRRFLGERVGRALMKVSLWMLGLQMPWLTCLALGQSLTHYPCSSLLVQMFENNRVKFYMQTEVSELRAQEGKVGFSLCCCCCCCLCLSLCLGTVPTCSPIPSPQLQELVLKSSKVLRADVCVVGIGE